MSTEHRSTFPGQTDNLSLKNANGSASADMQSNKLLPAPIQEDVKLILPPTCELAANQTISEGRIVEFQNVCAYCIKRGCIKEKEGVVYSHGACNSCSLEVLTGVRAKKLSRKYGLPVFLHDRKEDLKH